MTWQVDEQPRLTCVYPGETVLKSAVSPTFSHSPKTYQSGEKLRDFCDHAQSSGAGADRSQGLRHMLGAGHAQQRLPELRTTVYLSVVLP